MWPLGYRLACSCVFSVFDPGCSAIHSLKGKWDLMEILFTVFGGWALVAHADFFMKKHKLIFWLVLVILSCLCVVACIMVLNVPREKHLATIELPSGDRIIIKFCYRDLHTALLKLTGHLEYDIYSGQSRSSGQLPAASYDLSDDVRLTYEIQGARRVKIEEGRQQITLMFEGDSSGKYKIIGSYEQPQEIE